MESPVVLDKPPEYHGSNERGFPFDDEEGSGAWSELASRHPDIAARLRQRPATATWARKRRPSSQDPTEDLGDNFGFDRFPFDDIPPEFRDHFPTHWNRRAQSREEPPPPEQPQARPPPPPPPPAPARAEQETQTEPASEPHLPQYGLRNTVDLGQKSAADPSLVDAGDRSQRSMSAPPDARPTMSANQEPQPNDHPSNVRVIPIFVEGRDEPVVNRGGEHFEPKQQQQQYAPPPTHIDREQYFADDAPVGFHPPPNFSRAFGTPFNRGFRQGGSQPFVQQKAYPQTAFTRGASPPQPPQRAPSPKPHDEHFVKVPVHHEPPRAQPQPQQKPQPPPQQHQPSPPPRPQQHQPSPPPRPQPPLGNDPISQIYNVQLDVQKLHTEVENFTGTKNDKYYLFLDEMLTRNLLKLDNVETGGKENIKQARKETVRFIESCIAVLDAKAASNTVGLIPTQDVDMKEGSPPGNGELVVNAADTEKSKQEVEATKEPTDEQKPQTEQLIESNTQVADTRQEEDKVETDKPQDSAENKAPKKGTKNVKKRDKSKDKNKEQVIEQKEGNLQAEDKGDKTDAQAMEVDGAASQ